MAFLPLLISKISYIIPTVLALLFGLMYCKGRSSYRKQVTQDSVTQLSKLQAQQLDAINQGELLKERVDEVKKNINTTNSDVEFTRLLSTDPTKDSQTK